MNEAFFLSVVLYTLGVVVQMSPIAYVYPHIIGFLYCESLLTLTDVQPTFWLSPSFPSFHLGSADPFPFPPTDPKKKKEKKKDLRLRRKQNQGHWGEEEEKGKKGGGGGAKQTGNQTDVWNHQCISRNETKCNIFLHYLFFNCITFGQSTAWCWISVRSLPEEKGAEGWRRGRGQIPACPYSPLPQTKIQIYGKQIVPLSSLFFLPPYTSAAAAASKPPFQEKKKKRRPLISSINDGTRDIKERKRKQKGKQKRERRILGNSRTPENKRFLALLGMRRKSIFDSSGDPPWTPNFKFLLAN